MREALPQEPALRFGQFLPGERPASVEAITAGHINATWLVRCESGARYILQRINRAVFPDVDAIMENIALVSRHLARAGAGAVIPRFLAAQTGRLWLDDGQGGAWRLYRYVDNSVSKLSPDSDADLLESGRAFGGFLHALRDLPPETLRETIPDFHNTPVRFRQLRGAMKADVCGRRAGCAAELDFALRRETDAGTLWHSFQAGALPRRAAHNDTKLSNVLFDQCSGKAVCVIDLDTVMPGLAAWDFGDAIRAGAAAEDEHDTGKVLLSLDRFRAFTRGFLEGCPSLTEGELAALPQGAMTMTLECGVRFLADHLAGDRYFRTAYPEQNLTRCRAQFALLRGMEAHAADMADIVFAEAARIGNGSS